MAADKEGTEGGRPPQLPGGGFRALPLWGLPHCSPQQCPGVPGISQAGRTRSFFPEKGTVLGETRGNSPNSGHFGAAPIEIPGASGFQVEPDLTAAGPAVPGTSGARGVRMMHETAHSCDW